jgi:hypothetical protein
MRHMDRDRPGVRRIHLHHILCCEMYKQFLHPVSREIYKGHYGVENTIHINYHPLWIQMIPKHRRYITMKVADEQKHFLKIGYVHFEQW